MTGINGIRHPDFCLKKYTVTWRDSVTIFAFPLGPWLTLYPHLDFFEIDNWCRWYRRKIECCCHGQRFQNIRWLETLVKHQSVGINCYPVKSNKVWQILLCRNVLHLPPVSSTSVIDHPWVANILVNFSREKKLKGRYWVSLEGRWLTKRPCSKKFRDTVSFKRIECFCALVRIGTPHLFSRKRVCPLLPEPKGEGHTSLRVRGLGRGSQFGRLDKKPRTLSTLRTCLQA